MRAASVLLVILGLAGGAAARMLQAAPLTQCAYRGDVCLPSDAAVIALGIPEDEGEM